MLSWASQVPGLRLALRVTLSEPHVLCETLGHTCEVDSVSLTHCRQGEMLMRKPSGAENSAQMSVSVTQHLSPFGLLPLIQCITLLMRSVSSLTILREPRHFHPGETYFPLLLQTASSWQRDRITETNLH